MTSTEPTEADGMSARVLEIIGAYRMDADLDARDLYAKAASRVAPEPVLVPAEGYGGGVDRAPEAAPTRRDVEIESPRRSLDPPTLAA